MKYVLNYGAYAPTKAHQFDAGWDLKTPVAAVVKARDHVVIDTGVKIAIPKGFVGVLQSKSGLMIKHGIVSDGTIDSGYTGTIAVRLDNLSNEDYVFCEGDKITQLVVYPIYIDTMEEAKSLEDTERGENGFGSSGK